MNYAIAAPNTSDYLKVKADAACALGIVSIKINSGMYLDFKVREIKK